MIGTWNINSFYSARNPDNLLFKRKAVKYMYFDILVIPEHHCLKDQKIEIDNFTIFQYNRQSGLSKHGSGGIAIAAHNTNIDTGPAVCLYKFKQFISY